MELAIFVLRKIIRAFKDNLLSSYIYKYLAVFDEGTVSLLKVKLK